MPQENEAWQDWLTQLSNRAELRQGDLRDPRPNLTAPTWCAVVADETADDPTRLETFGSVEELRQFLTSLDEDVWALPFYGWSMSFTVATPGSRLKYLVRPDGVLSPLFDLPDGAEIAEHYYRGDGPLRLMPPLPELEPAAAHETEEVGEESE